VCKGVTWPSHQLFKVIQKSKALLIGHGGEGVVRVNVLQTGDQVSQRVVGAKGVYLTDEMHR